MSTFFVNIIFLLLFFAKKCTLFDSEMRVFYILKFKISNEQILMLIDKKKKLL